MWDRLSTADFRPGGLAFYSVACLVLAGFYTLAIRISYEGGVGNLLMTVSANLVPIVLCGFVARLLLLRYVLGLRPLPQLAAHVGLAIGFAAFWFWLLMVLLGVVSGSSPLAFSVRPFLGAAALWQLMQGVTFYAVIALLAYVERLRSTIDPTRAAAEEPSRERRLFVRDGDEIRPLDPDRIVKISGAGDYVEILTRSGKHLLRTTLSELTNSLGERFLRVHRSHIVNIDRIARMEPAGGGRMALHLENGETVTASRAGAKAIRERAL